MTLELAAIFLKYNHEHTITYSFRVERGALNCQWKGQNSCGCSMRRDLTMVDDIAKRHLGDGVALFCIINEHFRLNNSEYRERQQTKHKLTMQLK